MHNPLAFDSKALQMLDAIGAEPLAGSGFENEQSAPSFEAEALFPEEEP